MKPIPSRTRRIICVVSMVIFTICTITLFPGMLLGDVRFLLFMGAPLGLFIPLWPVITANTFKFSPKRKRIAAAFLILHVLTAFATFANGRVVRSFRDFLDAAGPSKFYVIFWMYLASYILMLLNLFYYIHLYKQNDLNNSKVDKC